MISISKLSKKFGEVVAVDDVSLEVKNGEFLTLLGPSGSGKTTVLRMIAGFEKPDSGTIKLDGKEVTKFNEKVAKLTDIELNDLVLFDYRVIAVVENQPK